jgi:hypothetical protein
MSKIVYSFPYLLNNLFVFLRRLKHHWNQLYLTAIHIMEIRDLKTLLNPKDTSLDDFGIRKMIVAATDSGKIAGIDSQSGEVAWHLYFPYDKKTSPILKLFVLRGPAHFGHDATCAIVYTDERTGAKTMATFNPQTGLLVEKKALKKDLSQVIMLHHADEQHLKPLLLLHRDSAPALEPSSATEHLSALEAKMFVVTLDDVSGTLVGQQLTVDNKVSMNTAIQVK